MFDCTHNHFYAPLLEPGYHQRSRYPIFRLYDRYFGPNGTHFTSMVLLQQAQTVFLQATGKLSLLGAAAWAVDATQCPAVRDPDAAEAVTVVFWCLTATLAANIVCPCIIFRCIKNDGLKRDITGGIDILFDVGESLGKED